MADQACHTPLVFARTHPFPLVATMPPHHFTTVQLLHLAAGLALVLWAIIAHARGRSTWALGLLTLGALVLRTFAILLDPYLSFWDEAYHAAVARHLVQAPFTPMLYTVQAMPLSGHWTETTIWLHKPPFFLWQMAASIGLFGPEPWAVRLPSALWTTALVPVTHRMARLITGSSATAFMAATFTACAFFLQEIVSGALNTDHNDAIFISLVACSWWAWLEHRQSAARRWVLLIGLFSAAAVLTKWYLGFSVFLPWALVLFAERRSRPGIGPFLSALALPLCAAAAWIGYCTIRFPNVSDMQWSLLAPQFTAAVEDHPGPWSYHLDIIHELVPPWSTMLVGAALIFLFLRSTPEHRIFLATLVLGIHLAFGLASTKMPSYTMPLLPLYLIALAHGLYRLSLAMGAGPRPWLQGLVTATVAFAMLGVGRSHHRHTVAEPQLAEQAPRRQQLAMLEAQDRLATLLHDPGRQVVFNMPAPHSIQFMFRTGYNTMEGLPPAHALEALITAGYEVVVLQDTLPLEAMPNGVTVIPAERLQLPHLYP